MNSRVLFDAFPKQREFIQAALSGTYRYLLYGGAIRGGKSTVVLAIIILLAKIYPRSRWVVVRRDLQTIKRNTLPSFSRIAPRPFCGDINLSTMTVPCGNGSEILFMPESIATDKELNRFRGLEVNGFVLEEANELHEDTFNMCIQRAGPWGFEDVENKPPILILLTCNPSQGWVRTRFYNPFIAGTLAAPYYYLPAKIFDNPHIPSEYLESLKSLPPEVYKIFVDGDWNVADDPLQVIPYRELHARLAQPEDLVGIEGNLALGVDVGELGNDSTALTYWRGGALFEIELIKGRRTDEVAAIVQSRIMDRKIDPLRVGIDAIGVGAGVWGQLKGAGLEVQRIIAGGAPIDVGPGDPTRAYELQFKNLKSQMWWQLRQDLLAPESQIQIIWKDSLIQDLTAVRYSIPREKMIVVEPKEETKKRIGRSPDEGDSAVIGNWVRCYRAGVGASTGDVKPEVRAVTMEDVRALMGARRRRTW